MTSMTAPSLRAAALLLALALPVQSQGPSMPTSTTAPAHVTNSFDFEIAAPFARLAPLFGPEAERAWAGEHWNPVFLYPQPAKDVQGAVFTIQHGPHTAVWINTLFDLPGGRMQYVYVIPERLATTIDVSLRAIDATHTAVHVTYTRTALDPAANDDVNARGEADRNSGPEWKRGIEACLHLEQRN